MLKKTAGTSIFVGLIILVLASRGIINLITDWWWYKEIQNTSFFFTSLEYRSTLFVAVFLVVFIPSWLTIYIARKLAPLRIRVLEGNLLDFPEHLIRPYLFPLLYAAAVFISLFTALSAAANWTLLLPLFTRISFGTVDPIFNHDVGFYVFYLPLLEFLCEVGITAFLFATVLAVVSYGIQKVLKLGSEGLRMAPVVSTHLSILLAGLALFKGMSYWLARYQLLLSQRGSVFGIGYADYHARIPLLDALTVLAIMISFILLLNIKFKNWKPIFVLAVIWGISSVALLIYPKIVQQLQVIPSELDKERGYLEKNILFTRKAYGLDQVKDSRIAPAEMITSEDRKQHEPTLENIRLWDRDPLQKSLSQLQEIRPYYTFRSVDVDRYMLQGKIRQVMISARELDYGRLQNPTWANEHLIFTHGYGFVATPVNQVTSEGLPDFFVKNIPPAGLPELHANDPAIYYGEALDQYCIVNSKQLEFDYPSGDENKSTHYHGTGGVALDSIWKRLIYAFRFSFKIFFSSDVDSTSRILYYRPISWRLSKAFPLLAYDQDPYIVVDQGRLYWICDAYALNDHYPYAHPVQFQGEQYNYIRNSAKAVIDAYNGTVTYYVSDSADPILKMYAQIFPGIFHPLSEMPKGLQSHIRVPEDYFMVQATVYSLYHMINSDVFYNREDLWQLPHPSGDEEIRPYYVIMQVPGSDKPEFLLILPFTPSRKDNLAAWMAARCDEAHYGEKLVFEFPKESLVFGPSQIQARINQDPKFSELRTLWGQQGSRIMLGHLQVIPVGNAILYVEPLYIKAEHRELPELKLVLLAFGDRIVMESSLQKALSALFKEQTGAPSSQPPGLTAAHPEAQSKIMEALHHYRKAMEYQKTGDWTNYGIEIKKLGGILESLQKKYKRSHKSHLSFPRKRESS